MTIMAAAAIASGVAGAVSAVGALQQASATAQAADYNAAIQDRNAVIAEQNRKQALETADLDAQEKRLENRRTLSAMRAAYGSSGLDLAGSPLDVLADSATELELSAQRISYEGRSRARDIGIQELGMQEQSNLYSMEADNARIAGPISAFGYLAGGVGTGLARLA